MRISKPNLTDAPWYLKPFFWAQRKKYGQVLMPSLVWAKMPKLFMAIAFFYGYIDRKRSPLTPALRTLVTLRVSQINWCEFCVDINSMLLIKRTGTEQKWENLPNWRQAQIFSPEERAALDYAEKMTYSDQHVDDSCFDELKKYFPENAIIELTALIAFQNLSSKFNSALGIEPQEFCSRELFKKSK